MGGNMLIRCGSTNVDQHLETWTEVLYHFRAKSAKMSPISREITWNHAKSREIT